MENNILVATARPKQAGTFQEENFVAGVIYGKGIETAAVKFDEAVLSKIIETLGDKAAVTVEFAGVTMTGFIKEVQRTIMGRAVSHVDVQIKA